MRWMAVRLAARPSTWTRRGCASPKRGCSIRRPCRATRGGPHRLVYLLVDPANPERAYVAGSETFDVGSVTVLGVRTEREPYPHTTDSITATLTVFATAPTDADLTLLVDDMPVVNITLALTAGVQTVAVPLPGPIAP